MSKCFGEILREKRKEKGLSQLKLAEKANTHFTTISYYERQKREPTLSIALNIANALDCSVYELCGMIDNGKTVTCEKCVYCSQYPNEQGNYKCGAMSTDEFKWYFPPNHFCGFGKKRGNKNE